MNNSAYKPLSLTFFIFLCFTLSSAHNKTHNKTNSHHGSSSSSSSSSSSWNLQVDYKGCFSKVYAFGDSDTDTGNAQSLGAHMQINVSSRLVVDFLCDSLSLPPICPFKKSSASSGSSANSGSGVNFAVSGSTALPTDHFAQKNVTSLIWNGTVPVSFEKQIEWFERYLTELRGNNGTGSSLKADIDNALFWIGQMGVSDYSSAHGSNIPLHTLADVSVKHVSKLLQTLLDKGAKYIVVQGLPPVGCFPLFTSTCPLKNRDHMGCAGTVNKAIMTHNQILQWELQKFQKTYPKCSILYADYWNAFLTIMMNPKKYQFEEPFKACCGCGLGPFNFDKNRLCGSHGTSICKDPHKFINWDGIHLTEAMHKHLADLFLKQGFCHPSFADLVKSKKFM